MVGKDLLIIIIIIKYIFSVKLVYMEWKLFTKEVLIYKAMYKKVEKQKYVKLRTIESIGWQLKDIKIFISFAQTYFTAG